MSEIVPSRRALLGAVPALAVPVATAPARASAAAAGTRGDRLSAHATTSLDPRLEVGQFRGARALAHDPAERIPHGSDRVVLAHYHPFYPLSKDNAAPAGDFYTERYLVNTGDGRRHLAYGGLLRDRPLPRSPLPGDFRARDHRTEVRRAVAAGLDGFAVDLIGTYGSTSDAAVRGLLDAAEEIDRRFTITLVPDLYPGALRASPSVMATYLAELGAHPNVHRQDGRLVVSPFGADREGASYWRQVLDLLRVAHGERAFFVPCLLDYWAHVDDLAPISDGLSAWGYRNVGADVSHDVSGMADDAHARGKLWMHPVAYGDSRPARSWFNESENTGLLRHTFQTAARQGAEWVQVLTWNDYAENTHVSPSPTIGWAVLDLVGWFADSFRAGRSPRITRDVLYLSHRRQLHSTPGSLQPLRMEARPGTQPRDLVEALVFLSRPATVQLSVGGTTYSTRLPAGVHTATAPLSAGLPSVRAVREGRPVATVSAMFPVVERPQVQTMGYYIVSSGRTGS